MFVWIVVGVILLALVVLAGAVIALLGHVRILGLAARRLLLRAEEADKLQARLAGTQERLQALQGTIEATASEHEVTARAERLRPPGC